MSEINVNLKEGSFSINGSEEFIAKHKQDVFDFVQNHYHKTVEKKPNISIDDCLNVNAEIKNDADIVEKNNVSNEKDKYKKMGIYSVDLETDEISIHRKVPGNNNADKMKNIAMIVLFEKGGAIESSQLKKLCEKQSCWDSSNVAAVFERDYKNFIKKKISQKVWTLELTINGEEAAKQLLEEIANNDK